MFEWLGAHALYLLLWLSFALGHSLLAGDRSPLAVAGRASRLLYNFLAVAHLAIVLVLGHLLLESRPFDLPPLVNWARMGLAGAGLAVLVLALRQYDLRRFAGLTQLRGTESGSAEPEPLRVGGLNRYVRHPLYLGGILFLVGLADSQFGLATALWGSIYFLIGSRVEERRLLAVYGAAYERYRRTTPAFLPRLQRRAVGVR